MVGKEFINLFNSFHATYNLSVDDFADRLNLFTVLLFLLCTILISAKQYVFNSISCYIPVQPSGSEFKNYLADYCWVHGTIPLRSHERMPTTADEWNLYDRHRRITYYQWVPFLLGLQCIIFYLPHLLWEVICNSRAGGDVFTLIQTAKKAGSGSRNDRKKEVQRVAEFLEDMIETHRCPRRGRRAALVNKIYSNCGLCVISKRMGTCLVWSYLALKVIMILNAALQLHLIQIFLGFTGHYIIPQSMDSVMQAKSHDLTEKNEQGYLFGWAVVSYIRSGREWPETLLFPRVAYCRVPSIRLVGGENAYTAQCALPINMLNEKIYIFLWFWILFLLSMGILSFVLWIFRTASPFHRHRYIARYLRVCKLEDEMRRRSEPTGGTTSVKNFVDDYLRQDGVFLIRMVAINVGHVMATDVVEAIWQSYREKVEGSTSPLTTSSSLDKPSAPQEKIRKIDVGFV
ncbi:unnamed protein product [Mesocestoides corti]|uniref:Innexin n=2 Tax=Mesocestoides corti TaxID=53468 RepID=A0A0R3UG40_MESCO|nr:unnamed protein product [Mesocestoides corti]